MTGPFVAIAIRFAAFARSCCGFPLRLPPFANSIKVPGHGTSRANWNNCAGGNGVPAGTPGPADRAEITAATAILPAGAPFRWRSVPGNATIQGSGIGVTTLDAVAAGTIAWGAGSISSTV